MRRYRPTSVLILAILHLVGGGLGLLFGLIGLVMQAVTMNNAAAVAAPAPSAVTAQNFGVALTRYAETNVPGYNAVQFGGTAFGLLLDVLLLAAGMGLLYMQPWARVTSLVYAVLSILYHLLTLVYSLAFILPVTNEFIDKVSGNPGMGPMATGARFGAVAGMLAAFAFILYPIIVLVVLLLPRVAAAFRGAGRPEAPDEPEDYLDADRPFRPHEPPSDAFTR
jgi:hypothetical protein